MKSKIMKILIIIMFIVGFGILSYPVISNFFMEINQTKAIQNYNYTVDDMVENEKIRILKEANEYNEKFKSVMIADPFSNVAAERVDTEYKDILNINGTMGYIEIPKINVNLPIYHGTSEEVLKIGVGHIETTPLPVGGAGNHSVLSAHRGLPSAELFSDLDKVEVGDMFYIKILNETLYYEVDQIKVIEPTDTEDLQAEKGKDYITLITCTPYAINTHRLLVRGERVETPEEEVVVENNNLLVNKLKENKSLIIVVIIIIILFLLIIIGRNKNKSRGK